MVSPLQYAAARTQGAEDCGHSRQGRFSAAFLEGQRPLEEALLCSAGDPGSNNTEASRHCQCHCHHHIKVKWPVLLVPKQREGPCENCLTCRWLSAIICAYRQATSMYPCLTAGIPNLAANPFATCARPCTALICCQPGLADMVHCVTYRDKVLVLHSAQQKLGLGLPN